MRRALVVVALLALVRPAPAQTLEDADRVRLAEAFRLADHVRDGLWPGWSDVPFAVLLVTPDHEFLVRHPRPSDDFALVAAYDSLLGSPVYARERQYPPHLLATFPAVGGLSTVVVGTPAQTGTTSTEWAVTLLHEHVHQYQTSLPDYYGAVAALDLSGGDTSGMWMLDYPFPYSDRLVGERFEALREALVQALAAVYQPDAEDRLGAFLAARDALREALSEADDRYLSFQLWQEGIARYAELRVATRAADLEGPAPGFLALDDATPYAAVAESLRSRLARDLADLDLAEAGRLAFYPLGAAQGLLLDALRPGWRQRYLREPFALAPYFEDQ